MNNGYVFLRRAEDELVEAYFKKDENIRHLTTFLNSMDALAYFAEILHAYVEAREDLSVYIHETNREEREKSVKAGAEKLDFLVKELIGTLELGNLADFARANYEAYEETKKNPKRVGLFGIYRELRDPDVQLALGFIFTLLKRVSYLFKANK
ncbi:DUF1641 domain-containing protein [Hydrogenobacter hydrogenophilus]|uniref:Uncharacterized conserved protein YjgD, DUF1641 family n=1 Tax=Hydrogenobacter hydrogenophilus TaxID=35835 RepID=A0A285P8Z8_9AQUI|nr:DUF1641 domain-containing protein [Hydrogenobacter hydrogenophilus]SNZ16606.1 Uncharacterized conserved protein YjgD, DUF1641 family [Hydrogenobacter hydrogenophilus]